MKNKLKEIFKNFLSISQVGNRRQVKKLNGAHYAARALTVLPRDTFLVSYPKSGNTWLRFLVGNLIYSQNHQVTFTTIESLVPDIYRNTDKALLAVQQPRYLKSHEPYDPRYTRVIHLIRDPRDIAVSYYYHLIKVRRIRDDLPIDQWLDSFLQGSYHPQFGTWESNAKSWMAASDQIPYYLQIRYEDLQHDPIRILGEIATFLGYSYSSDHLKQVIDLSSADRMRKLESQEKWQPFDGDMRQDISFIRSAKSGDGKEKLSLEALEKIEQAWGETISRLGYEYP
ncbi:sulfotransferase domain-containing protein [Leptolyngbya sp. PCC 6406]|uniref:sulfotransferase domain-containing protein n=1 Tax=Leptolyngbya sp. PCC 6406 TaxID=1173264 RepID=UPI0002ACAF3F|nr:sulfotransferase domain-containing protein [Leptolyngbya sp. PCC 6406]